ncbi:MAG: sensor histidine kinase [Aureliella sp.]
MLWNAVVMSIASMAALRGLREGVRYTLLTELDDALRDDFAEVTLALVNVYDAHSLRLHAQLDRKARGHIQRAWFVQIVQMDPAEDRTGASASSSATGDSQPAESPGSEGNRTAGNGGTLSNDAFGNGGSLGNGNSHRPHLIWQTFNVPDWSMMNVPPNFDQFILPDGMPTTVDEYRVVEKTIHNALSGPVRVRIGASLRSIRHLAAITDQLMLFNVFISLVVAPMGGYWLALRATKPLNAMIRTVDRLRPQQMNERLPISKTEDEIDQLSVAFNRLLDRIAEYLIKRQDFLANSAHELRTPLAALRSSAELALSSPRSVQEYQELMELIVSECGNLEQLVNQLLLLSEAESAHFESRGEIVDLSKITSEACDMFGAVAESRDVNLRTHIAPGVFVDGSRLHLRQLLNNLIDNAIKFIPGTGEVTVEVASSEEGQRLVVRDTGVGIGKDEQLRLFERFYRGDRSRRRHTPTRGTGLGLSICRAIAEAHGGTITIQSEPGVGTEVTVRLPRPCHGQSRTPPPQIAEARQA